MEDDRELLGAIAQGSKKALQSYYERHAHRLMGYVLRAAGDRALAEDVVQDVFTSIWLKASSYRSEHGAPLAWMYMIARHTLVDRWRRRLASEAPEPSTAGGLLPELVRAQPELALSLERALEGLSLEQRQAVERAVLGGSPHAEAATTREVPLGPFKSRVRRALSHMRALLTEPER